MSNYGEFSMKKSYMDTDNIISEGIFDRILNAIRRSKLKKDKKIQSKLSGLNKDVSELEKLFNQKFKELDPKHKPIKLDKYKISDFL
tara:strand:- start:263 stop:523 length:261 start_codon:yes stop_codon:yes gene_type:complete